MNSEIYKKEIVCKICGAKKIVPRSAPTVYCSRRCYLVDQPNLVGGKRVERVCTICGKVENVRPFEQKKKFCSTACANQWKKTLVGDKSASYKGGYITAQGYKAIKVDGKYRLEHVLVYEREKGIKVPSGLIIHHKNGNRLDNSIDNLEMLTARQHILIHVAKVSDSDWEQVYALYLTGKYSHKDISAMIGIDKSQISRRFARLKANVGASSQGAEE